MTQDQSWRWRMIHSKASGGIKTSRISFLHFYTSWWTTLKWERLFSSFCFKIHVSMSLLFLAVIEKAPNWYTGLYEGCFICFRKPADQIDQMPAFMLEKEVSNSLWIIFVISVFIETSTLVLWPWTIILTLLQKLKLWAIVWQVKF